jgi:molybdopterin-guanine dinucleotide biosynthesis protein A
MISAALLAGGQSRRMGRDKCLIDAGGLPLWQRQVALLSELSPDVAIVAAARPDWCPPTAHWLPDRVPGCGPLGGLDAALAGASHPRLLLLAVDLPDMTGDYLQSLIAQASDTCGVVPVIDGLFQPLSAIYPRTALPAVMRHLSELDKSLQRLLRELVADGQMKSLPVAPAELSLFRNLNTPQD